MKYVIFDRTDRPVAVAETEADATAKRDLLDLERMGHRVLLRDDDSEDVANATKHTNQ